MDPSGINDPFAQLDEQRGFLWGNQTESQNLKRFQ